MSETEKLRVLLAEARDSVALLVAEYEAFGQKARLIEPERQLVARVDAALAEPVTAEYSQDEVNEMTTDMIAIRKEAERAAYQRGAEAMREAAAQCASKRAALTTDTATDKAWCRSAACIEEEIRAMPIPEDKR